MRNSTFQSIKIFLIVLCFGIINISNAQSTKKFKTGTDTLVVYSDVPGLAPSDKFTIRVRSAATNNEWVQCFANYTYNRGLELPKITAADGKTYNDIQGYIPYCSGWSQTYANIEMSENSTVEVEISKIGSALLDGVAVIEKSAVHPSHKVFDKRDENGKVYFKINNPCQVVIDINGQMDDHNYAITGLAQIGPVHALTFFANPVIQKPLTTGVGIRYVTAGTTPDTTTNYSTMVFGPGVHHIGAGFKIYAKKSYYIPGDAIVYGSLTNGGTPVNGRTNGDGISIYGYGTLCGFHIPNSSYSVNNTSYPNYNGEPSVGIVVHDIVDLSLKGITIADPGNAVTSLSSAANIPVGNSKVQWVKGISWRVMCDGINGDFLISDCFLRTSDDTSILEGVRKRCTYWKDSQGNIIRLRNYYQETMAIMEDCDFIYHRRRPGSTGTVFRMHNGVSWQYQKQIPVNVTIRNIRFHDRKANMRILELDATDDYGGPVSYYGLKFENISFYVPIDLGAKSLILGTAATPWNEGLVFSNVTFNHDNGQPPVVLTKDNFTTYFDTNEFVSGVSVKNSPNYTLTINKSDSGTVVSSSDLPYYADSTLITLTAIPKSGYEFTSWSGDVSGNTNPTQIAIRSNMIVSANFQKTTSYTSTTPGSGSWIVPVGVDSITINVWGAGGAGGSAYSGTATLSTQLRGGGGAGGSFASKTIQVTSGQVVNYTVGAGGSYAISGFAHLSAGGSGEASQAIINGDTVVYALGGLGGVNVSVTDQIVMGAGGIAPASGSIGDIVFYGGKGGTASGQGSGGGGGSAGSLGNGGNGSAGIAGLAGAGGGVVGGSGINISAEGRSGETPGGGGSGAANRNGPPSFPTNNTHKSGGKGANGMMIIYLNPIVTNLKTIRSVSNKTIDIYPNPATDKLFFNSADKLISKILLVDLTGKIVLSTDVNTFNGTVYLKGIAKGLYLVKIYSENSIFAEKICIK